MTTPGLKLEMLRMTLFASSDICIEARSSLIWPPRLLSSLATGGRRLLGTERFSVVTRPGLVSCSGAGAGRISPTGGEHWGGPELQPTQLHETWAGRALLSGGPGHDNLLTRAEEEAIVVEHLVGVVKPGVELARVSVAADSLTQILTQDIFLKSSKIS